MTLSLYVTSNITNALKLKIGIIVASMNSLLKADSKVSGNVADVTYDSTNCGEWKLSECGKTLNRARWLQNALLFLKFILTNH